MAVGNATGTCGLSFIDGLDLVLNDTSWFLTILVGTDGMIKKGGFVKCKHGTR